MPVPPSLGYTPDGLLVLQALPGQTLRDALRGRANPAPPATAIQAMLDRLPPELAEAPPRRSWPQRADHYAAVIATLLPAEADRARQLAAAITAGPGAGAAVPVHGDLYEAQLHVAGGRITGLLDIDTAGPGERLDDLACLLGGGHLVLVGFGLHLVGQPARLGRLDQPLVVTERPTPRPRSGPAAPRFPTRRPGTAGGRSRSHPRGNRCRTR